jgi:phosphomannomutase
MRSISGVRGIVGQAFSPVLVGRYINAYVQEVGRGRILVGRDTRDSGEMVEAAVVAALTASGCDAVLLGVATTPTVEMAVQADDSAVGGLILTASHNPAQWNALKMLDQSGLFLGPDAVKRVFERVDTNTEVWVDHSELGSTTRHPGGDELHIEKTLALPYLDVPALKARRFKVVVDCVNGAAYASGPAICRAMGCDVIELFVTPDGKFPRGAEPVPEALALLGEAVRKHGADVGLAFDPDGDRLALVDENGTPLGEEATLALAVDLVLSQKAGPVVVNLSTSRMNEDLAAKHGVPFARTPVGEIHVSTHMLAHGGLIGGEGNGGVILPELHPGRDGLLAVAFTLEAMRSSGQKLSEMAAALPQYVMIKRKFALTAKPLHDAIAALKAANPGVECDERDGFRLAWPDAWVHLRASNTEPVVRVIAEAPTTDRAESLCAMVEELL